MNNSGDEEGASMNGKEADSAVIDDIGTEKKASKNARVDSQADTQLGESPDMDDTSGEGSDTAVKSTSKKRRAPLILIVLVLILCCAAAAGWYVTKQFGDSSNDVVVEPPIAPVAPAPPPVQQIVVQEPYVDPELEARIAKMSQELTSLRGQIAQQNTQQSSLQTSVSNAARQTESQLLSLANRITEANATESGDWILAEAEYLLRIANQRLVTSQDINGAIEMMRTADDILRELAYPELTEVRRQLVADITRLDLIQPIDREGIYFTLDALRPAIDALVVSDIERLEATPTEMSALEGVGKYWEKLKQALSPYVVVKSDGGKRTYLISNEQDALIKSQIQLDVRQAQLAMVSGRQAIYTSALNDAAEHVRLTYGEEPAAQALMKKMSEYASRSISQDSIDINESVRVLGKALDKMTAAASERAGAR